MRRELLVFKVTLALVRYYVTLVQHDRVGVKNKKFCSLTNGWTHIYQPEPMAWLG